jgi:hypothetical protein
MFGRGFALVDTPPLFDSDLFPQLKRKRSMELCKGARRWQFPQLFRYGCWLEALLHTALPEEAIALASLEVRHEPAGYADFEVDRLHADGSYIRSVCTLYGPATVYRDCKSDLPVPNGQTLLMTALNRAKAIHIPCTLHRRPDAGLERAVIVCSFEPRSEIEK